MIAGFLVVLSVADGALVAFSDALKRISLSLILSLLSCEKYKLNITTVLISRVMFHASSYFTTYEQFREWSLFNRGTMQMIPKSTTTSTI